MKQKLLYMLLSTIMVSYRLNTNLDSHKGLLVHVTEAEPELDYFCCGNYL